jgi:hypothetical protein
MSNFNTDKQKVLDILNELKDNKFTGILLLQFSFNQGGIRSCDEIRKQRVSIKSNKKHRILTNPKQHR